MGAGGIFGNPGARPDMGGGSVPGRPGPGGVEGGAGGVFPHPGPRPPMGGGFLTAQPDTTTATHIPPEPAPIMSGMPEPQQDQFGASGYGTGGPLSKLPSPGGGRPGGYQGTGPGGRPMTFGRVMPGGLPPRPR